MYCPKCGDQNSDDLAYCRACGENLKIISQVMTGTFPQAIARKVDAAIEKKNGRLIRAAVVTGIFGILHGNLNFLTPTDPHSLTAAFPLLLFGLPGFFFLMSVYYILTYRRSLEVEGRTSSIANSDVHSSPIFCTNCRAINNSAHRFCHSCGHDQALRPRGLARVLPAFILRILDGGVARNEAVFKKPRSRLGIAISTIIMFAFTGYFAFIGAWWMTFLMGFFGVLNVVTNGWDYLTYARNKQSKHNPADASRSTDVAEISDPRETGHLGAFLHEMQNIPLAEDAIEFEDSETRPRDLVPLTEATTKPLHAEMELIPESVPTTRKLDKDSEP